MKKLFDRIGKILDNYAEDTYLIAGLGNPGRKYEANRHNVGYMVIDTIANKLGVEFRRMQSKALVTKGEYAGKKVILVKPRTFMNLSGQAVGPLVHFYKVPQKNILVIFDDADLPFESLRLRPEGGSGGQKGARSVFEHLGTEVISRLRVGIGRPPGRMETPAYVLQDFSAADHEILPIVMGRAADAALMFVAEGITAAMNEFNRKET